MTHSKSDMMPLGSDFRGQCGHSCVMDFEDHQLTFQKKAKPLVINLCIERRTKSHYFSQFHFLSSERGGTSFPKKENAAL